MATQEWQAAERGLRTRLETAIDYNSLAWPITVLRASPVFTCTVCLLERLVGLTEAEVLPKPPRWREWQDALKDSERRGRNGGRSTWRERWGLPRRGTEILARERSRGRRRWEEKNAKLEALPLPSQPQVSSPQTPRAGARSLSRVPVARSGWVSASAPPRSPAFLQVPPAEQPGRQRRHLRGRAQPGPVGGERAGRRRPPAPRAAPPHGALVQLVAERLEPGGRELRGGRAQTQAARAAGAHRRRAAAAVQGARAHDRSPRSLPASGRPSPPLPRPLRLPPPRSSRRGPPLDTKFLLVLCVCCADGAIIN